MRFALLLAIALFSLDCRPKPDISNTPDRSEEVDAQKADPPAGAREIGPVEVTDGGGCGALGMTGTENGALRALRNKAATMGANYVKLTTSEPPHETAGCFDKGYTMRGIAYSAPTVAAATPSAAPTTSATP
jgi:hypothetical protein